MLRLIVNYQIDLAEANASNLPRGLEEFVGSGRRTGGRLKRRRLDAGQRLSHRQPRAGSGDPGVGTAQRPRGVQPLSQPA
jgi:hypothetical protein